MQKLTRLIVLAWILSPLIYAQSEPLIPAKTLRSELNFIVQTIEEVHPDPYTRVSKEVFKREVERILETMKPMSSARFLQLVKPLVESLQDGHTSVSASVAPKDDPLRLLFEGKPPRFEIPQPGVGLLDIGSFWIGLDQGNVEPTVTAFSAFLETAFSTFQAEGVETLIIDLRRNGGGSSRLSDMLLEYITDKPYRSFASTEEKISEPARENTRRYLGYLPEEYKQPLGTVVESFVFFTTPEPNPLRFSGDVFVLTSKDKTFSMATYFAATVKDLALGTLIGEETKGLATDFSASVTIDLSEVDAELRVSTTYFVRPGNFDDGRGVLPDVKVPASQALQWVLSHAQ